jgi:hypothetical protein
MIMGSCLFVTKQACFESVDHFHLNFQMLRMIIPAKFALDHALAYFAAESTDNEANRSNLSSSSAWPF